MLLNVPVCIIIMMPNEPLYLISGRAGSRIFMLASICSCRGAAGMAVVSLCFDAFSCRVRGGGSAAGQEGRAV